MHNTTLYYSVDHNANINRNGDTSAMLNFMHHATSLASYAVEYYHRYYTNDITLPGIGS